MLRYLLVREKGRDTAVLHLFALGEVRRGEGEPWFVCGWLNTTADRVRMSWSGIKNIMDITEVVLVCLRRDEKHEPRGDGWSLSSNNLDILGSEATMIGYHLGSEEP